MNVNLCCQSEYYYFLCQILLVRDAVFGFVFLNNLVKKVVSFPI